MIGLGRAPCGEAVIRAAADTPGGGGERARPWVLVATILGSSLVFIDGSVVNVALPAIQADLGMAVEGAQWVVTSYLLMLGALLLVGGAAGNRFGRRRMFALGAVVFTAFSVVCGVAPNASILIAGRALQGVGGALLVNKMGSECTNSGLVSMRSGILPLPAISDDPLHRSQRLESGRKQLFWPTFMGFDSRGAIRPREIRLSSSGSGQRSGTYDRPRTSALR
jgi:hypothetical protein